MTRPIQPHRLFALFPVIFAAAFLTPLDAQTTLVSDDFNNGTPQGSALTGTQVETSSSGSPTYNLSNSGGDPFYYDNRNTTEWFAVPQASTSSASNSIEIVDLPSTGVLELTATFVTTTQFSGGLAGSFIGLTNQAAPGFLNNIGSSDNHLRLRFVPQNSNTGSNNNDKIGRIQYAAYDPTSGLQRAFTTGSVAAGLSDEIELSVAYDLDTLDVTFSATNLTQGGSISSTVTLGQAISLDYAQFDLTGLGSAATASGDTRPGFDDFEVTGIPEPSAYAAVIGALGLCFALSRRRRRRIV